MVSPTPTPKRDALAILAVLVGGLLATPPTATGVALGAPLFAAGVAAVAATVRRGGAPSGRAASE
jgi:hypothetical protein